jgi:MFS family permease
MATAVAPGGDGIWDRGRRALTLGLVLTVSMGAFESLAVATIMPVTVRDIGGLDLYGWAFSAFMLANLVGITSGGAAADRHGAAPPFVVGTALFVLGLLGAGAAMSMQVLVLCRVVQGLGAGSISAVALACVARAYPPTAKPRMLAMLSTAWVVPGMIGPALAAAVADHIGWRWVFLGLIPLTGAAAALAIPGLRRLPAAEPGPRRSERLWSTLCLAAGAGAVLLGVSGASLLLAVPCVALGMVIGVPAFGALTPPGTLRGAPGLPAAVATAGLLCVTFFGAEVFVPLSLTTVRAQAPTVAGLALTAATLTWTAGAWLQARLAARRSRSGLVTVGLLLLVAGVIGTASVLISSVPIATAVVTWGLAGLGMGLSYSTTSLVVIESVPSGEEGTGSAAFQLATVVGSALGTGAGGGILGAVTSAGRSEALGVALVDLTAVLVGIVGLVTVRRLPPARVSAEQTQ